MEYLKTFIGIAVGILTLVTTLYPNISRNLRFKLLTCWLIVGGILVFFNSNQYKYWKSYDEKNLSFRCYQFPPVVADNDKFYYRFIVVLEDKYAPGVEIDKISFRFQTRLDIDDYKILLSDVPERHFTINIKDASELSFDSNDYGINGGTIIGLSIDCSKPKREIDLEVFGATVNLSYSLYGKNHVKDYHVNPMSVIDLRYPNKDGVVFDEIKILDHRRLPNKFFSYYYYKEDDESGNRRLEIYCPDDKKKFLRLSYQSNNYSRQLDSSKNIHNDIDPLRIMVMANNDIKIYSWLGKFRLKKLAEHFRDGLDKVKNKEFSEAAFEFDAVTKSDSKDHEAWFNAGLALELSGELDEAIKRFKAAIAAKEDYSKAYYELGNVYIKTSKYDNAVECLNQAIELKPDYALAYFRLGCLQKTLGQLDESIVNLKKAIKFEKNHERVQNYKQCLSETLSHYQFSEEISD